MRDLNFFGVYESKKKQRINTNIYIYGVVALVGFIIISSFAFNMVKLLILEGQTEKINKKLNTTEIQAEIKDANNINSQIDVLNKYNNALTDISKNVNERNNSTLEYNSFN